MDSPIASIFKKARLRLGITQTEVATLLGQHGYRVGQTFITMVERSKTVPANEHAGAIARAFGLTEQEVIGAIMATKYPGLKLAATPMPRPGLWVDLSPQEQKRIEAHAANRDWPSASAWARKALLAALDAQADKK